jgi:UDP-N-acetyl-D-galactosamine dehydrogenase
VDVIAALTDYGISVTIYDPGQSRSGQKEYKLVTSNTVPNQSLMVLAVAHAEF